MLRILASSASVFRLHPPPEKVRHFNLAQKSHWRMLNLCILLDKFTESRVRQHLACVASAKRGWRQEKERGLHSFLIIVQMYLTQLEKSHYHKNKTKEKYPDVSLKQTHSGKPTQHTNTVSKTNS